MSTGLLQESNIASNLLGIYDLMINWLRVGSYFTFCYLHETKINETFVKSKKDISSLGEKRNIKKCIIICIVKYLIFWT